MREAAGSTCCLCSPLSGLVLLGVGDAEEVALRARCQVSEGTVIVALDVTDALGPGGPIPTSNTRWSVASKRALADR